MPDGPHDLVLLVNGQSRTGADSAEGVRSALIAQGFGVKAFEITRSGNHFQRVLRTFVERKEPLIAIGGGDGTQRLAAETIAGTASAMAVIPLGTGNSLAKDLGIPVGTSQMAEALASGSIESIDLGVANGRAFVNVATIGLTSLIVKNIPRRLKGRLGRLVYLPAVIRSVGELRPFDLRVTTDGDHYEGMALLLVAAAGRSHAGPFRVTRSSSNCDGLLSMYALDNTSRIGLIAFGLGLVSGLHTLLGEVWSCETSAAEIATVPPKRIIVDGEPAGKTPLALSLKARALRVLIPASGAPSAETPVSG